MALTNAELREKLSTNPRFKAAKKSGRAYVIPGAKQPGVSCATSSIPEVGTTPRAQITHRRTPLGRRGRSEFDNPRRGVSHFTFGRRKTCEALSCQDEG
jgi:hypothetical protein